MGMGVGVRMWVGLGLGFKVYSVQGPLRHCPLGPTLSTSLCGIPGVCHSCWLNPLFTACSVLNVCVCVSMCNFRVVICVVAAGQSFFFFC